MTDISIILCFVSSRDVVILVAKSLRRVDTTASRRLPGKTMTLKGRV